MDWANFTLILLLGGLGAFIGWRSQTKRMRWRSFLDQAPGGMSTKEHARRRRWSSRIRRWVLAALYGAVGAGCGLLISLFLSARGG